MSAADGSYKDILIDVLAMGELRETRSGVVKSTFSPKQFEYDMSDGTAPLLTGKQIFTQQMIGELLWFLNGEVEIGDLKYRTWGDKYIDKETIWTADFKRWVETAPFAHYHKFYEDLGRLYGEQWRDFAGSYGTEMVNVDQISKLIKNLKGNPSSRYHIVNSWNAAEIDANQMALPPCHVMFQCYVSNDGKLSLKWYQRSVDCFLGLPFNIASYGLLLSILCSITGYNPGKLIGTFGDAHIYKAHFDAVKTYMHNPTFDAPVMVLPEIKSLDQLSRMTALDFKGCYENYKHAGPVSAPLLVG